MLDWGMIADGALTGLVGQAALLDAEHSAYGLDAAGDPEIIEAIAMGLRGVGLGVLLDQAVPDGGQGLPAKARRCPIVVTERAGQKLFDESAHAAAAAARPGDEGGLFDGLEDRAIGERSVGELAEDEVTSDEAGWFRVVVTGQQVYRHGVPVPNGRYQADLTGKPEKAMATHRRSGSLETAGVFVVLFASEERVVKHDLVQAGHALLSADEGIDEAIVRSAPMTDRVGNGAVGVLLAGYRSIRRA